MVKPTTVSASRRDLIVNFIEKLGVTGLTFLDPVDSSFEGRARRLPGFAHNGSLFQSCMAVVGLASPMHDALRNQNREHSFRKNLWLTMKPKFEKNMVSGFRSLEIGFSVYRKPAPAQDRSQKPVSKNFRNFSARRAL